MPAPDKIIQLIERFERNKEAYKSHLYNETQARREFIDPLFAALGWDMNNDKGKSEAYKDVIHEDSIKVGGMTKAPDYCFRIGGTRKFFVEAKKPYVNIKDNPEPAYQLRRYGWNQKLPLSILTDFDEFSVYDCRIRPQFGDKASTARIMYFTYHDYIDKWDTLASIFSIDGIEKGSFDKFAESKKDKKGTQEVDDAFLQEIESWREILAKNIALRNVTLTARALNDAVQKTIDRIVFLRICEDRNIEEYGQLQKLLNVNDIYSHLRQVFLQADSKFNSGLFHFNSEKNRLNPDNFTLELNIDDKPLKDILRRLYYPESPYEFSIIPIEILGQVYERFLGKVIRLTAGHQAKVEEKPEVRKAGGVYYTPQYIVEYIVKNTVGKLLEDRTPEEAKKLSILDPACGSGSFLIGAFNYLLDWYLQQYTQKSEKYLKSKNSPIYQSKQDEYKLTISEKKDILLSNIYGVDIDSQAVEVTKLSLMLKALEGETDDSINRQLRLYQERALPDLDNNIKCGNSLIGTDFYADKDLQMFDTEEQIKINCFDWEEEFPHIFKGKREKYDENYLETKLKKGMEKAKEAIEIAGEAYKHTSDAYEYARKFKLVKEEVPVYNSGGGFDVVISNPPYVNLVAIPDIQRNYFQKKYKTCRNKSDLYSFFIEKACELIRNKEGKFSFIVPHTWLATESFEMLRKKLLNEERIENITEMGFKVFDGVTVSTVILVCSFYNDSITVFNKDFSKRFIIPTNKWVKENYHIDLNWTFEKENIYQKISKDSIPLEKIIKFSRGIKTSDDKRFIHNILKNNEYKSVYRGKNIKAYSLIWNGEYIWYRPDLMKEKVGCLPHSRDFFEVPEKLITQRVNSSMQLLVAYDNGQNYFLDTTNVSRYESWDKQHSMKYIIGVLNSKMINYWYCNKFKMPTIGLYELHSIPFKQIDFSNPKEKSQHDRMVSLVEQMLEVQKEAHSDKNINELDKKIINQRIKILDKQIDTLVYELYGLSEDEIKIVEGR
jgi:type I restriction-modification system DNA methylase subunit